MLKLGPSSDPVDRQAWVRGRGRYHSLAQEVHLPLGDDLWSPTFLCLQIPGQNAGEYFF